MATSFHWYVTADGGDLLVKISDNDGATWTEIWNENGETFVNWEKNTYEVDITSYAATPFQIAFNLVGDDAAAMAIDNVKITEYPPYDIAVLELISPVNGIDLTASEVVKVKVKNNGSQTINSVDLDLTVDGFDFPTVTCSTPIAPLKSIVYTFPTAIDLSAYGTHEIVIVADLAGDANIADNKLEAEVKNIDCSGYTLPFTEDFSGGFIEQACWTFTTGSTGLSITHSDNLDPSSWLFDDWCVDQPYYADYLAFDDDFAGGGSNNNLYALLPALDFSATITPKITLDYLKYGEDATGSYYDKLYLEYTIDNGSTYNLLANLPQPSYEYDWDTKTVDLAVLKGKSNVRIAIHYDDCNHWGYGFGVDNIHIWDEATVGIAEELTTNAVLVYPNPAKDFVNIQVEETSFVKVYNVAGKLVDTFTATAGSNNRYQNVAGVYLFSINGKTYKVVFE
jgi:hypothetical protein